MIKKTIFAIALLAMLAMTVQAGDLAENPIKKDPIKGLVENTRGYADWEFWWPYEICYEPLEICQIPIVMEVGMYIEMTNCTGKGSAKIVLKQVPCEPDFKSDLQAIGVDFGKGSLYPCYAGCTTAKIRANFDFKVGTKLYKTSSVIDDDKWVATLDGGLDDVSLPGDGNPQNVEVCVYAWSADIWLAPPDTELPVGEVALTVKPDL